MYSKEEYTSNPISTQPQAVPVHVNYVDGSQDYQPTVVTIPSNSNNFNGRDQSQQSQVVGRVNSRSIVEQRQRPMRGRWLDGICDWPTNLFPSCWCACCCCYGMYLVGQMSEKTEYVPFRSIFGAFLIIWIISFIVEVAVGVGIIVWVCLSK